MKKATILCHYVRALMASLERNGQDPMPLLLKAGIAPEVALDNNGRIPFASFSTLVRDAWRVLDDENFGLGQPRLPIGAFYFAGHLMIGAATLGKALRLGERFYAYTNNGWSITFVESGGEVRFDVQLNQPQFDPDHLLAEFVLTGWHHIACWLIGKNIPLKQVNFDYPAPAHEAEYRHIFPAPRRFNQPGLSFTFSAEFLDCPIVQNTESVDQYLKTTPQNLLLGPLDDDSVSTKIRQLLENHREDGFPSFEQIAESLHMTTKTLRGKLKSEGITYQKHKDVMRRDLAIHYLTQQNLAISQIAQRLGFSEPSAFNRAFKTWTGITPGGYRHNDETH